MKKQIISLAFLCILLTGISYATVGVSSPSPMNLKPGDEGRFGFQIQSTSGHGNIECTPTMETDDVLEVTFDEDKILLEDDNDGSPNIAEVTGTVEVSENAKVDDSYKGDICVSCVSLDGQKAGASTKKVYCAQNVNVQVVDEVTKENQKVPPKYNLPYGAIIVGIIVAIILIGVFVYHYKEHHKKEKKVKVGTKHPKDVKKK